MASIRKIKKVIKAGAEARAVIHANVRTGAGELDKKNFIRLDDKVANAGDAHGRALRDGKRKLAGVFAKTFQSKFAKLTKNKEYQ